MKSPQFPIWSPETQVTKGGSVFSSLGSAGSITTSFTLTRPVNGVAKGWTGESRSGDGAEGHREEGSTATGSEVDAAVPPVPSWKRVFDCVGIALSLPISLPLGLVIAGWIKLVSRGPVFFRQERVGLAGQRFEILKFRSMSDGAPTHSHEQHLENLIRNGDEPMQKLDGAADPRIISGGRCLRAMGLDELPQLINVLRGHMSLVGPRPSTPNEFELYTDEQKSRVSVLPGLTGYWQVSGKNKLTFQQMISLDLQYVAKMSLGLDLAIVVATVPAMLLQFMESRTLPSELPQPSGTTGIPPEPVDHPSPRAC